MTPELLEINLKALRIQRNIRELKRAEIDRDRMKKALGKVENYINNLKDIISKHMLDIQNKMEELRMTNPESLTEVEEEIAELLKKMEKQYTPEQTLRMVQRWWD